MENKSDSAIDVEIVGFNAQDRVLIASMFKVSNMRTQAYREWNASKKIRPDCVIFDVESKESRARLELASMRKKSCPLITVGPGAEQTAIVDAHIQRPIRWAGVLHTLDTVLNQTEEAPVVLSEAQSKELSSAVNELELAEVIPWYDRDQPVKEFQTDAAVLVVDPDPGSFKYISDILTAREYRVDQAIDIAQANAMLEAKRYNCVVLEMDLPDQDGIKFCKQIKQSPDRRRKTAVVILTPPRTIMDRMRGSMAGCDAFLNKPVDAEALVEAMEKFLPKWKKKA